MPRAYPQSDYADLDRDSGAGEWQALRGELVALLDKVENHYGQAEPEPEEPAISGLTRRVRQLRDQMSGTETASRRREALQTVKRAVDRFSDRDDRTLPREPDDLTAAIAEIRSRQGMAPQPVARMDLPEIRELGSLVGGMSQRLERLEGELRSQRGNNGHVREVAGQVEQLTQVVELLAGAVGETGQVRRLEAQIAALGVMIEEAPKGDLSALNARLDDLSTTVGKLAELQAEQMEREVAREKRRSTGPKPEQMAKLAPAMQAIEESVRNVYDRIDAIEKNVALSSGDFETLTKDLASFTQAMKENAVTPDALIGRVEALTQRFDELDISNGEVAGLKDDIGALRDAVLKSMEPRFTRIEHQIEALSGRVDSGAVEDQLKALMARMDDAGAQLDGLARLYADGGSNFESLANMVAERTSEAMARKVPAPVAMFGPESLKSIEDRLTGLIKSAGKTPDYDTLADMIASRASEAAAKSAPPPTAAAEGEGMQALEKRMTALLNTAGKDTAERLARLEAMLTGRTDLAPAPQTEAAPIAAEKAPNAIPDPFREAMQPVREEKSKLNTILAELANSSRDSMPANPADDAPLVDPGFKREVAAKPAPRASMARVAAPEMPAASEQYMFDPSQAQKPPRPQSSLDPAEQDPFAPAAAQKPAAMTEAVTPVSSTSTFVAAARRAQRAKQAEAEPAASDSLIGRALARVRTRKSDAAATEAIPAPAPAPEVKATPEDKPARGFRRKEKAAAAPLPVEEDLSGERTSFLSRHRRPLLLAATLVAVSMLALNLVMQRSNGPSTPAPQATNSVVEPTSVNPPPSDDQSSTVPPRVIDMIDPTATGSINPGEPMNFSKTARAAISTPQPPELAEAAPESDVGAVAPAVAETYELPAEAVGPLDLREAAAQGDARAQFEVAAIFSEGRALEQDFAEAAKWYERSAAQGFAPAQYRMGSLYEAGTGVEQDLEQARLWYQRAAEAGNRMAMHNLAALYAGGQLGDQEFELAAQWFQQAADHGMTDSQFNLGMLYARGLGVDQNFEQSYKWFSLAARSGDKDAAQARDDIAKSLSAEAVGRINGEIGSWRTSAVDLAANFAPIGTWSPDFDPGTPVTGREVVVRVQQALARLGFDVGTADGVAGPKTAEAIKAFEAATGMSAVGKVNPRLLAVLGSQPV